MRMTSLLLALAIIESGVVAAAQTEPSKPLTMDAAVRAAVASHPTVAAARHAVAAAKQRRQGAGAFPNPEVLWQPFWGSVDVGGSDEELVFAQPLDVAGRRRLRAAAAGGRVTAAEAEADRAAADLALAVKTAYLEVLLARELQALNDSLVETAKQFRDAAQKRFDVGDVPRIEVDRAALELARAEQESLRAQAQIRVREATLNELLGRDLDAPLELSDKLEYKPVDLGKEDPVAVALRQRPELRAAEAELAALQGDVRVAGAERRPDLEVQAKRNEIESGGDSALMLVLSAPVLDYGALRHEVAAAKADAARQQAACDALRRQVRLEVTTARAELTQAETLVKRYQQTLLPTTDRVTQTIRRGFDAGASTMLDVLDAQRTQRSVQTEYQKVVADYLLAVAKLRWAMGQAAPGQVAAN